MRSDYFLTLILSNRNSALKIFSLPISLKLAEIMHSIAWAACSPTTSHSKTRSILNPLVPQN